jgi:hypothetical protein
MHGLGLTASVNAHRGLSCTGLGFTTLRWLLSLGVLTIGTSHYLLAVGLGALTTPGHP